MAERTNYNYEPRRWTNEDSYSGNLAKYMQAIAQGGAGAPEGPSSQRAKSVYLQQNPNMAAFSGAASAVADASQASLDQTRNAYLEDERRAYETANDKNRSEYDEQMYRDRSGFLENMYRDRADFEDNRTQNMESWRDNKDFNLSGRYEDRDFQNRAGRERNLTLRNQDQDFNRTYNPGGFGERTGTFNRSQNGLNFLQGLDQDNKTYTQRLVQDQLKLNQDLSNEPLVRSSARRENSLDRSSQFNQAMGEADIALNRDDDLNLGSSPSSFELLTAQGIDINKLTPEQQAAAAQYDQLRQSKQRPGQRTQENFLVGLGRNMPSIQRAQNEAAGIEASAREKATVANAPSLSWTDRLIGRSWTNPNEPVPEGTRYSRETYEPRGLLRSLGAAIGIENSDTELARFFDENLPEIQAYYNAQGKEMPTSIFNATEEGAKARIADEFLTETRGAGQTRVLDPQEQLQAKGLAHRAGQDTYGNPVLTTGPNRFIVGGNPYMQTLLGNLYGARK